MAGSIFMQRCAWSTDNAVQPTDQEPIGPRAMASTRDATDLTACGASTQPGMQMLVASRRDPLAARVCHGLRLVLLMAPRRRGGPVPTPRCLDSKPG
jgi:hypothetical protein